MKHTNVYQDSRTTYDSYNLYHVVPSKAMVGSTDNNKFLRYLDIDKEIKIIQLAYRNLVLSHVIPSSTIHTTLEDYLMRWGAGQRAP